MLNNFGGNELHSPSPSILMIFPLKSFRSRSLILDFLFAHISFKSVGLPWWLDRKVSAFRSNYLELLIRVVNDTNKG